MGTAQNYHRMALECLELAEAARDPAAQDALIRMAELWARLADRAEAKAPARWSEFRHDANAA
jgi:hypothetical protein